MSGVDCLLMNCDIYIIMRIGFVLFIVLIVLCWPLALAVLILYPLIWLIALPFRILGFAIEGVLDLIKAIFLLPGRILNKI